jgi:hypothetical protein
MRFKKPASFSKVDLLRGFQTLNKLWERNLLPEDLERHYFLHWFAAHQGNIIQTAGALQIHRNTIQGRFLEFGFSNKTVDLRHFWLAQKAQNKKKDFCADFFTFYQKFGKKPVFTREENERLVALWRTGFPPKTLTTHYIFWAVRTHKTREWIGKKLDYVERHRFRLLVSILNPKTRDGFWLAPLKPGAHEIYSAAHRRIRLSAK